ncbi:MAG: YlbF family regulator [Phascolarctobacterium sp.]|nr:YlbF family regulator [Phascolarctobacterium sp.]
MNVYDCGNDLAKAIRESHEFKKLKEAKAALDPQGKEMADKFIRLNMEAQMMQAQGKEPEKSVTEEIQNVYKILALNSAAMEYLNSFMRFNMMMNDIMKNIEGVIKEVTE